MSTAQEVVRWSPRLISTLSLGFQSGRSLIPQPEASGAGSEVRRCPDLGNSQASGTGYSGPLGGVRVVYLAGSHPIGRGAPPRQCGAIGRSACQSPGTFPGVGQPGPPAPEHFLVPAPFLEEVGVCCGAGAWSGCYPVPGPGAGRGEWGAVPQGPHPQVSRPGLWMEWEGGSLGPGSSEPQQ